MKQILKGWLERFFSNEETILLTMMLVLAIVILATLGHVLGPVIAALILAFLLQGMVNGLCRIGLSEKMAILTTYLFFVVSFLSVLVGLVPIVGRQTSLLMSELPNMIGQLSDLLVSLPERFIDYISPEQFQLIFARVAEELAGIAEQLLTLSISSFPGILAIMVYLLLVPLLVFFMLKDKDLLLQIVFNLLPRERKIMTRIWTEMTIQFANYMRGKAIEIIIVGAVSWTVFLFLELKYATLLALLVGLSVLVPYIGATVVTLPVFLVGYLQWGYSNDFLYLVIIYGVIQFLDGNVLVPLLFSEVVNLHPVAIVIAVLLFGGIWGFWGVFFAIPLATLVKAVYNAWPRQAEAT